MVNQLDNKKSQLVFGCLAPPISEDTEEMYSWRHGKYWQILKHCTAVIMTGALDSAMQEKIVCFIQL